jgi:hypothetical protein
LDRVSGISLTTTVPPDLPTVSGWLLPDIVMQQPRRSPSFKNSGQRRRSASIGAPLAAALAVGWKQVPPHRDQRNVYVLLHIRITKKNRRMRLELE